MKFLITIFFVIATPLASSASKWIERGNGGFVLRCNNIPTQTFDLYEAKERFGSLDQQHLKSVDERVQYLLSKLDKINPSRGNKYRKWYTTFFNDAKFVQDVDLIPVPDLGFGYKPKDCFFSLAVFQREPDIFANQRYTISHDLWDELDIQNRAALILHELIYREVINSGDAQITSESTRYFNALLNSNALETMSMQDYLLTLQGIGFQKADYGGFAINLRQNTLTGWKPITLRFFENGGLREASLDPESTVFPKEAFFLVGKCLTLDSMVSFYRSGMASTINLNNLSDICQNIYHYDSEETSLTVHDRIWRLSEKGVLTNILGDLTALTLNGVEFSITSSYESSLDFEQPGILSRVKIFSDIIGCRSIRNNMRVTLYATRPTGNGLTLELANLSKQLNDMHICERAR